MEQALKEAVAKAVGATASDSKLSTLVESARRLRLADLSGPQSQSPDSGIPMTVMSLSVSRQHLIVQSYIDTICRVSNSGQGRTNVALGMKLAPNGTQGSWRLSS